MSIEERVESKQLSAFLIKIGAITVAFSHLCDTDRDSVDLAPVHAQKVIDNQQHRQYKASIEGAMIFLKHSAAGYRAKG
ncbi:MAG: hypothetical protein ACJ74W_03050 [Pyrinomonadaceae bacterium]